MNTLTTGTKVVQVTESFAEKVRILRPDEANDSGFQRPLNKQRSKALADYFSKPGRHCPPIVVASIGEDYIVVDGQHRLSGWKEHHFDLYAQISPMTLRGAKEAFIVCNSTSVRVPLLHRLRVDPGETAKMIRTFAQKYEVSERIIFHVFAGIMGDHSFKRWPDIDDKKVKIADLILARWTKDPRWNQPIHRSIFGASGTLRVIGVLARERAKKNMGNIDSFLDLLAEADYSRRGTLGKSYGTSGTSQQYMRQWFTDWLVKRL